MYNVRADVVYLRVALRASPHRQGFVAVEFLDNVHSVDVSLPRVDCEYVRIGAVFLGKKYRYIGIDRLVYNEGPSTTLFF